MEGELKKGTARPLSMGRIVSHVALFPLAGGRFALGSCIRPPRSQFRPFQFYPHL